MASKKIRSLRELYQDDPQRADALLFGRVPHGDRRGFLRGAGLAAMGATLGAAIPFHRFMPSGLIPVALAETTEEFVLEGKDGLIVLNDRPINAETPAHLLDDDVTPTARHFVRNNGIVPDNTSAEGWKLVIDGEVERPLELTIEDLKSQFEVVEYALQLECGGNGRAGFNPPAKGNQWTLGAIGNSKWTGVRLKDVLEKAGVKPSAVYTGHFGADTHLSGDPDKQALSRGMPIEKALDPYNLIAFQQNGQDLHPLNGAPLRLVVPGWPGSCSQKWLTRIWVRDRKHDGSKMEVPSYSVPAYPVAPGTDVPEADFVTIHSMPVKSMITSPQSGETLEPGQKSLALRGHAWAGDAGITKVEISNDFGATWSEATLKPLMNPYSWVTFESEVSFPTHGYYEIWARATDENGIAQPFAAPWNPKGYLNNAMHRIAVMVPRA
ncbi:sulfite oxidase [Rhodospirillales bacterium YIM 152171]|uniref:Sulfite oxidase n=2 Tax=Marinimicrococcus flavescens TaxID=3031815 RepID=A0AAP3XPJ5_9PROT|nr:sulfite oxidase [Marinimicrococcus flavescens]